MAQEGLQHGEILCNSRSCPLNPRPHGSSSKYDLLREKYPVLFHSAIQKTYSLILVCFQWAAQVFCPACVTFNMLLLTELQSWIASQDQWKWECAQSAYIDINTPHHIINTFGRIRLINPFSCIQKNHHLPESTERSRQWAGLTGVRVFQKVVATHRNLWARAVNGPSFVSKQLQGSNTRSVYRA